MACRLPIVLLAASTLLVSSLPAHGAEAVRASRFAAQLKQLQQRMLHEAEAHEGGFGFFPGERLEPPGEDDELGGPRGPEPVSRALPARILAPIVPDVRANNTATDNPGATQSELAVVAIGDNVLVAWNDGQGFNQFPFVSAQGYAYSTNGGQTFTDGGSPPVIPGWRWESDPVLTVNESAGEFWYLGLAGTGVGQNGIGLVKATFTGGTVVWGTPHLMRAVSDNNALLDKPWLAVDPSTGRLYVSYTVFSTTLGSDSISFQHSADGGVSWSDPLRLSSDADASLVQGSRVAVGPAAEVYVTWSVIGAFPPYADRFPVRKSTNNGASFGPEVTAATLFSNFSSGAPGFNRPRGITFPSLAVDRSNGPHRGRVHLIWNECVNFYGDELGLRGGPIPGGPGVTETEPNDTPAQANSFTIGDSLSGTLTTGATDFFKFTATQDSTVIAFAGLIDPTLDMSLRFICGDGSAMLALSAPGSGYTSGGLLIYTIPASGTYYLRLRAVGGNGQYRIYTGTHKALPLPPGERARDHRDVFAAHSDDGVLWSVPKRVNNDPAHLDNWLPEVTVSNDSKLYAIWYDWRDASATVCNAASQTYLASSDDGGDTWATLGAVSNGASDWTDYTNAKSNIQPNQGDYLGLFADCQAVYAAWGDVRDPDVNAYVARYPPGFQPAVVVFVSAIPQPHDVTITWQAQPVAPLTGTIYRRPAGGPTWTALGPFSADGAGKIVYQDNAVSPQTSYEYQLGVESPVTLTTCPLRVDTPAEIVRLSVERARPNPTEGQIIVTFQLPSSAHATLRLYDITGREIHSLDVGSLGPGRPTVNLGAGLDLEPGLYFVRLEQLGQHADTRVTVLR